jgi:integrase
MSIRKRGDSWQIDVLIPTGKQDAEGNEIKERIRRAFKKKKEANAEHDKIRTLVREKRFLDVKKDYRTRLSELVAKYKENFGNQASFMKYKEYCLDSFKAYFGEDTLLASIKYVALETYRNHLRQRITKNKRFPQDATVNRDMACLHHLFSKAVTWDMIDKNPFDEGESLLVKENNKRIRYLTEEEISRLLSECRPKEHLYRVVVCALNTGMKKGEILSLKWEQVRNGFIYVEQTKTKNKCEIPINDELGKLFQEIRAEQGLTSPYVFTYAKRNIDNVDRAFKGALRRAGIERQTLNLMFRMSPS